MKIPVFYQHLIVIYSEILKLILFSVIDENFIAVSNVLKLLNCASSLTCVSNKVFSILFSVNKNQESLTNATCPSSTCSTIVKIDSELPPLNRFVLFLVMKLNYVQTI
jgi:hypothetical protein